MHIFLTGFMGVGKTSVGKELSSLTGIPFLDLDGEIEKNTNSSISQIFEERGEYGFRQIERKTLLSILKHKKEQHIIALGGGTICSITNYKEILQNGKCIYLFKPWNEIAVSLQELKGRPLLLRNTDKKLKAIFEIREPFYKLAQLTVAIDTTFSVNKLACLLRLSTIR